MIFDTLAAIAEKHIPELIKPLKQARLFVFDGNPHDVLPKEVDQKVLDFLRDHFFLPFNTMAIEDVASCIVLFDTEKEQRGLVGRRNFLECVPMDAPISAFREGRDPKLVADWQRMNKKHLGTGEFIISLGFIENIDGTSRQYTFEGNLTGVAIADKKTLHYGLKEGLSIVDSEPNARWEASKNAMVAIQEIMYFNSPSRFVLQKTPIKSMTPQQMKKQAKAKIIPRSHQRPIYTLVTPKQAREMMDMKPPETTHASPVPHERRRHLRTLNSPVFTKMKGKTIVIPASWIGPEEALVGKHFYKVLVDK